HKSTDAASALDLAVKRYEALYGKSHLELIDPLLTRGIALSESDAIRARLDFDRALKIARDGAPEDFRLEAEINRKAGVALYAAGAIDAGPYLEKSYQDFKVHFGDSDVSTANAAFDLGRYRRAMHRTKEALQLVNLAMTTWSSAQPPITEKLLLGHAWLVDYYEQSGDHEAATVHAQAIGELRAGQGNAADRDVTPLFRVDPQYRYTPQRSGQEGWVESEFTIDKPGGVKDPRVVDHAGSEAFVDAALTAFRRWRYAPRYVDGQPVETPGV